MNYLFLIFIIFSFVYGQDEIDALLKNYEKESELSKKTKNESAGNLIVYTRDDLNRMQVESLQDILKSLRFFRYFENRIAQPDILNQDPLSYYSKSVRIYLNENELLTAITGSGLILFGNMEMDFIDHVEIYEGFPSFDFGVEAATVVIRLYTKTPEHDEGGRIKGVVGSYGTNKENIYYTDKNDNLSYFVYANNATDKKDIYNNGGETLRRDKDTKHFYGFIASDKHRVELHYQQTDGDGFLGSLVGNTPMETTVESSFINLSSHSKFMNDTLTLNLSYMEAENVFSYRYNPSTPGYIPIPIFPFSVPITSLDQTIKEKAFTSTLKKDWNLDIHRVSIGTQYRYKHFDLTDAKFNIPIPPIMQAYYRENVYSFFLQDLISINDKNSITLSAMKQMYKRGGEVEDPNAIQLRLGYIYSDEDWVAKTFLSKQKFTSEPYMTISPHYGNEKLESETYTSIFQEISYKTQKTLSKLILGYGVNKNMPILDQNFVIQNSDVDIKGYSAALEFTYLFNERDKLELQTNYSSIESPTGGSTSKYYNHIIRMLNSISKFDIYNELIINDNNDYMPIGYNYSAGVKYAFNKDLHFNIKGDNIFNSGLKRDYYNKIQPTTEFVRVPVIERRFIIGLEYLF